MGRLLKNKRAGEQHVAWHRANLGGPETLKLTSEAFAHETPMPLSTAGRRAGGDNVSPELAWSPAPEGTAQLLLVFEDPDVPMSTPAVHTVALIDPELTALPTGGLDRKSPAPGVRLLRSTMSSGYHGPEPIKGHGPHRYVFQLFALAEPLDEATRQARPRALMDAVAGPVLARGRLDGTYER
ncbi:YbhB/YbcL family Raf kinase inhibitor-like protein [Streptacidiphilus sp. MAP12-33]|uniref:YbhB/YbcL family Raf kinase inhibitor-like protein n=1 Tax=Streptacidiphilus sp. MAP12-33 TaxID=3156266 RepID=UPI0035171ACA